MLGVCSFEALLRDKRHNDVKWTLLKLLREKGYDCFDEVQCVDNGGSIRRIDILAFDPRTDEAYVIDPSVRFETNRDMDAEVQDDKVRIYRGCIQDLARRYRHYGERKFEVIGLWFGSRGAIGTGVLEFFERFRLDKKILPRIAEEILVASIGMINHHIYAN